MTQKPAVTIIVVALTLGAAVSLQRCTAGKSRWVGSETTAASEQSRVATADAGAGMEGLARFDVSTGGESTTDSRFRALSRHLEKHFSAMQLNRDPESADAMRALLRDSVAELAVAAILAFLDGGRDADTGSPFLVGAHRLLESAPTVRVLLLDVLGEINARVAAEYARTIFAQSSSPDEWAIALRNYVAGNDLHTSEDALADAYLNTRIGEALADEGWSREPTVGFLHTMDFAVLAPDAAVTARLAELATEQSGAHPAVQRIAMAQLRRMAHRDFSATMDALHDTNALEELGPESRAVLFAHGDLRDARQRQTIESYLSSALPEHELTRFGEVFPYFGLDVTDHLATQNGAIDMRDDADAVRHAFVTVQEWRRDARFVENDAALASIESRLGRLVQSIERGVSQEHGRR